MGDISPMRYTNISRNGKLILLFALTFAVPALVKAACSQQSESNLKLGCPDRQSSRACKSFQELIAAKDEDLVSAIPPKRAGHAYICFRQKEDVFFVLWYSDPEDTHWEKASTSFTQFGAVELQRFKHGVYEHGAESAYASGLWRKVSETTSLSPIFEGKSISEGSPKDDQGSIEIEGGTIAISHLFEDPERGLTHYKFLLQRSTGRFVETFSGAKWESTNSGRCTTVK